jgi:hypothetical protein
MGLSQDGKYFPVVEFEFDAFAKQADASRLRIFFHQTGLYEYRNLGALFRTSQKSGERALHRVYRKNDLSQHDRSSLGTLFAQPFDA